MEHGITWPFVKTALHLERLSNIINYTEGTTFHTSLTFNIVINLAVFFISKNYCSLIRMMYNVVTEQERVIYMLVIDIPSLLIGLVMGSFVVYALLRGGKHE